MYPKTSDETSITYIYSCYDYDKALEYENPDSNETSIDLEAGGTVQRTYKIEANVSNKEVQFTDLIENITYTARYRRILDKTVNVYQYSDLVTQRFEGVKSLSSISFTAEYDYQKNPNRIMIDLNCESNDLSRVAGAKVNLQGDGFDVTTDLLELIRDDDKYSIGVDITTLGLNNIIGKEITLKVTLYYENGTIGFVPDRSKAEYAVYVSNNNQYMIINDSDGVWTEGGYTINGNSYIFEDLDTVTSNEFA